jgi:hypothetical protein
MKNILRRTKFFSTWRMVSNIRCDICEKKCGGDQYKYPMKNILRRTKFFPLGE